MKDKIKKTTRAVIFTLGLVVLLYGASNLLIQKDMLDKRANGIVSEITQSIDVLVLGNSETYSSVVPLKMWEQKGITAYCCGTPDQKLFYSKEFLEKTFRNQSPKVVMLETNMLYSGASKQDEVLHKLSRVFPVFLYHNKWKTKRLSEYVKKKKHNGVEKNKGYSCDYTIMPASTEGYMEPSNACDNVSTINKRYVKQIKKYCEARGAKLVLYSTPSTVNWNMRRHNGVEKMSKELELEYVDLNLLQTEVPIDWEKDTRDKGDHMNYWGAKKVTSYLGEYLSSLGVLSDHRGDEKYEDWNVYLDAFNQQLAQDNIE